MINSTTPIGAARRLTLWPILMLAVLVAAGCGGSPTDKPKVAVAPVRGSVHVGGKPAVKAQVIFHAINDADGKIPKANGEVDPDGAFTLSTYSLGDGAAPGDYVVTVFWPDGISSIGGDSDSSKDRLGDRYTNPKTTPLRAKVHDGPNELKPFQLQR